MTKAEEEWEKITHPAEFPQNILIPLCFRIEESLGIWPAVLGGKRERFNRLEKEVNDTRDRREALRKRAHSELEKARLDLQKCVHGYLMASDPDYKILYEAMEEIGKFNAAAKVCYKIATQAACDMIGPEGEKLERVMNSWAGLVRRALSDCRRDLAPSERALVYMSDNIFVASYSQRYSELFLNLEGRELDSNSVDGFKRQLDVILNILRQMCNDSRYPESLEVVLSNKIAMIERLCAENRREL